MTQSFDGAPPPGPSAATDACEIFEIVAPVADATAALATAIQQAPDSLAGVSIAVSHQRTLLLNARAWDVFEYAVRDLPGLVVRRPTRDQSRALRFLLLTKPIAPSTDPM